MTETHTETQPSPNLSTEPGRKEDATPEGTHTQPAPNLSTEHQRAGDGRNPSDTLDRGQADEDRETPGGMSQERVEDRPNVGTTTPEAYPENQRAGVTP